jgi:hypothetical protein
MALKDVVFLTVSYPPSAISDLYGMIEIRMVDVLDRIR